MAPPRPPTELVDDAVAEILLRLPPDEPKHLFRASLVCKSWLRVLTDPSFHRRYGAFHRTPPPLLGLLYRCQVPEGDTARRICPTTAAPLTPYPYFRRALDCHHGRVLLHVGDDDDSWYFVVWDPVTGDRQRVPDAGIDWQMYTAAVFCAVSGCDHIDCHGGPFRVVFIATEGYDVVKVKVYSSETDAWSRPATLGVRCHAAVYNALLKSYYTTPYVQPRRGAVIGNEIFFTLRRCNAIIKYDLGKNCLSMINPPWHCANGIALMEMEASVLGFVCIRDWNLYLWSRQLSSEGAAVWVEPRVIELEGKIPVACPDDAAVVVGSAEGVDVIFVATYAGLFTFELKSGKVARIDDAQDYFSVLPYMSFYTPGCGTLSLLARRILADP